jgi:hypothetical protein
MFEIIIKFFMLSIHILRRSKVSLADNRILNVHLSEIGEDILHILVKIAIVEEILSFF